MHTTTRDAAAEPAQVSRRAAPRSTDPGEARRQHSTRRKIDCDGAREGTGKTMHSRAAGPSREEPRHHR